MFDVVGVFDSPIYEPAASISSGDQTISDLISLAQNTRIDAIVLAVGHDDEAAIWKTTELLADLPIHVLLAPEGFGLKNRQLKIEKTGSVQTVTLLAPPINGWNRIVKGLEDRIVAAGLLLFFCRPCYLSP